MTLEERVAKLEQRADQLDRLETAIKGLRGDFNTYRAEHGAILERILGTLSNQGAVQLEMLGTLQAIERRPAFRWPWERSS